MRYFYKNSNGSLFNLKSPEFDDVEGFVQITEEEFLALQPEVIKPSEEDIAKKRRIAELKSLLDKTDYLAIKYFEGCLTEEDYAPIKEYRQSLRDQINSLE